jgi:ABC-type nickel/cobalt efflux system permease component RcnA
MVAGLLRDLREEAATLVKQQVALAKTELKENGSRLGGHVAQIAIGGMVTFTGVIVLLIGVGLLAGLLLQQVGLDEATARWLGTASVGLLVALVGWGLLSKARKALAQDPLTPRKTLQSLKDDQRWAQNKLHHPHESTT